MNQGEDDRLAGLLKALCLDEMPFGMHYAEQRPEKGFAPGPGDLPTREAEQAGKVDWGAVFGGFSCVLGNIWRARKKHTAAWFSARHFGCPGGAFYLGFLKPQTDTIAAYVSSGIPGVMQGERYLRDPAATRAFFEQIDPPPAPAPFAVFQPLDLYPQGLEPELVIFFARPEVITGLHMLTMFVTHDLEAVRTPFGAGCSHLVTFARKYAEAGEQKAVLGGWDASCRKYYATDEISFAMPWPLFQRMLELWEQSFLTTHTWKICQKKIARSKRAWGEEK